MHLASGSFSSNKRREKINSEWPQEGASSEERPITPRGKGVYGTAITGLREKRALRLTRKKNSPKNIQSPGSWGHNDAGREPVSASDILPYNGSSRSPLHEKRQNVQSMVNVLLSKSTVGKRAKQTEPEVNPISPNMHTMATEMPNKDHEFEVSPDKESKPCVSQEPLSQKNLAIWISKTKRQQKKSGSERPQWNQAHQKKGPLSPHIEERGALTPVTQGGSPSSDETNEVFGDMPRITKTENDRINQSKIIERTIRSIARKRGTGNLYRCSDSLRTNMDDTCIQNAFSNDIDDLYAQTYLLAQIEDLKRALELSEQKLAQVQLAMTKNKEDLDSESRRMKVLLSSLSEAQELRYSNLLDVFNDNHNTLGLVESNVDYVVSIVNRAKHSSLKTWLARFTWYILENSMSSAVSVIHVATGLYSRLLGERS